MLEQNVKQDTCNTEFLNLKLGNVSLAILDRGFCIFIWRSSQEFSSFLPQLFEYYFPFFPSDEQRHLQSNLYFEETLPEELARY